MTLSWVDYRKEHPVGNFVRRDSSRTENDDWRLNVQDRLDKYTESLPVYENSVLIGWKIQNRYQ